MLFYVCQAHLFSQLKFLNIYALFGKSSLHLLMHLKRESFLFVSANIPFKLLGDYQRKNSYNLSMLYLNNHNLSAACFLLYSVGSTSDPVLHVRLFSEPSSSQQHLSPFSLFLPLWSLYNWIHKVLLTNIAQQVLKCSPLVVCLLILFFQIDYISTLSI